MPNGTAFTYPGASGVADRSGSPQRLAARWLNPIGDVSVTGSWSAEDMNPPARSQPQFRVESTPGVDHDRLANYRRKRDGINSLIVGPLREMQDKVRALCSIRDALRITQLRPDAGGVGH
jgi:hypothetical protein